MPSSQDHEAALFALAVRKPVSERESFLQAVCGSDQPLRQRLDALLAAHEHPETLLATQPDTARPTIKLDLADAPAEAVGQTLGRYKLLAIGSDERGQSNRAGDVRAHQGAGRRLGVQPGRPR